MRHKTAFTIKKNYNPRTTIIFLKSNQALDLKRDTCYVLQIMSLILISSIYDQKFLFTTYWNLYLNRVFPNILKFVTLFISRENYESKLNVSNFDDPSQSNPTRVKYVLVIGTRRPRKDTSRRVAAIAAP